MKLVMDEKLKHRLVGIAVIVSLAAIFAPAVMRKSSQRLDGHFSENIKLPAKPAAPNVVMTDENDVFKTIKVARVELPLENADSQLPEIASAQSIQEQRDISRDVVDVADANLPQKPVQLALNEAVNTPNQRTDQPSIAAARAQPTIASKQKVTVKPAVKNAAKKEVYSVQLGSLSKLANANALVKRLNARGYKANVVKVASSKGTVYKVFAGQLPHKEQALRLKTQLASSMQINGFVVNTGVS